MNVTAHPRNASDTHTLGTCISNAAGSVPPPPGPRPPTNGVGGVVVTAIQLCGRSPGGHGSIIVHGPVTVLVTATLLPTPTSPSDRPSNDDGGGGGEEEEEEEEEEEGGGAYDAETRKPPLVRSCQNCAGAAIGHPGKSSIHPPSCATSISFTARAIPTFSMPPAGV